MSIVATENAGLGPCELPDQWILQTHTSLSASQCNNTNNNNSSSNNNTSSSSISSVSSITTATNSHPRAAPTTNSNSSVQQQQQQQNNTSIGVGGGGGGGAAGFVGIPLSLSSPATTAALTRLNYPTHPQQQQQQKIMNAVAPAVACPPTASKKIRRKPESKPQSQINKCNNEKRRRELENEYIEQLGEFLQINKRDMTACKPDKAAILNEVVKTFRQLLERGKGDLSSSRCSKCPPDCADNCTVHPVQQGDVSSTEPPLPESSANGQPPEISAYFEAVEHYISSAGWVLLEINPEGVIECVSANIKELIQYTRSDLQGQSIYSFLHPGDHKILSPILNMSMELECYSTLSEDTEHSGNNNNDNNNNTLGSSNSNENCFPGGGVLSNNSSGSSSSGSSNGGGGGGNTSGGGSNGQNNSGSNSLALENSNNNSGGSTGLTSKKSIKSRIRMLVKHTEMETMEQKQQRQEKYEDVVIIAAPVRDDGDDCSSVLCLITRPEDDTLGDNQSANITHSQLHNHHNQLINTSQPQLFQRNLEQLTLRLDTHGKIIMFDSTTLRDSFQSYLSKERPNTIQELCHIQDQQRLTKHLSEVIHSNGNSPLFSVYRLRLGGAENYLHVKAQSIIFRASQPSDIDFIMSTHTILQENELANMMNNNSMLQMSSPNAVLTSNATTITTTNSMMSSNMIGGPSLNQQQQQMQQNHSNLPNYFQQNKFISDGSSPNNNNNGNNSMGGPLMTSVINGNNMSQQQQQVSNQQMMLGNNNNGKLITSTAFSSPSGNSSDATNFLMMDIETLTHSAFPEMDVFESRPSSRTSNSRPPSVTAYSPLAGNLCRSPMTPYQMQQPGTSLSSDQTTSPNNNNNGANTPTGNSSTYNFPLFGDDSSNQGKDKTMLQQQQMVGNNQMMNARQQQQLQQNGEAQRLRNLLTQNSPSSATATPANTSGTKKKKNSTSGESSMSGNRQSDQILKTLPRRTQSLLNSNDGQSMGIGKPMPAPKMGSQQQQPPSGRRSMEMKVNDHQVLRNLLNDKSDEDDSEPRSDPQQSELLKQLQKSTPEPQRDHNTMKNAEVLLKLGILHNPDPSLKRCNMDQRDEIAAKSARPNQTPLSKTNQMLASLLATPTKTPSVELLPQLRTIIPDIPSSSINSRVSSSNTIQMNNNSSTTSANLVNSSNNPSTSSSNSNTSSNNNSNNTNNQNKPIVQQQQQQQQQQINKVRSNHPPPPPHPGQQQPSQQQQQQPIRNKPSEIYLNHQMGNSQQQPQQQQMDLNKNQTMTASVHPRLFDNSGSMTTTTAVTPPTIQPTSQQEAASEWDPELSKILNEVIDIVPETTYQNTELNNILGNVIDPMGDASVVVSQVSSVASTSSSSPITPNAQMTSMGGGGAIHQQQNPLAIQVQQQQQQQQHQQQQQQMSMHLSSPGSMEMNEELKAINAIQNSLMQYEQRNPIYSGSPPAYPMGPNSANAGAMGMGGSLFNNNGLHNSGVVPNMTVGMNNNIPIPNQNNQGFPMPPNYSQRPQQQQQQQRLGMNQPGVGQGGPQNAQLPRYGNIQQQRQMMQQQKEQRERLLQQQQKQQMVVPSNATQPTTPGLADIGSLINNTVAPNVSLQRSNNVVSEQQLSPGFANNSFQQLSPGPNRTPFSPQMQPQQQQQQQQGFQTGGFPGNGGNVQRLSPLQQMVGFQPNNGNTNGPNLNPQLSPRQPPFSSPQPTTNQPQWTQQQAAVAARLTLQQQLNPMLNAQLTQRAQRQRSLNSPGLTRQNSFTGQDGGFPGPPSPTQAPFVPNTVMNTNGTPSNVNANMFNQTQMQRMQRQGSIPQATQHLPGSPRGSFPGTESGASYLMYNNMQHATGSTAPTTDFYGRTQTGANNNTGTREYLRAHVQNRQTGQQQQQQQIRTPQSPVGNMTQSNPMLNTGMGNNGGGVVGMNSPQQQMPGTPNILNNSDMYPFESDFYGGNTAR